MTVSLFAILVIALFYFLQEMKQTIRMVENQHLPGIIFQQEGLDPKFFSQMEILIGRDPQNDLQLDDETISARHARVFYNGNHWMIEDSQSTNGTFLNGERILSPTVLVAHDVVECGKIKIKVAHQPQS